MKVKDILGLFIAGAAIIWFSSKSGEKAINLAQSNVQVGANWQASIRSDDVFLPISSTQFLSATRQGANMILFASMDTCRYSNSFQPVLRKYLNDHQLQVANLNFSKERGVTDFNALQQVLGTVGTPSVYAIRDGRLVEKLKGSENHPHIIDDFFKRHSYLMQQSNIQFSDNEFDVMPNDF